MNITNDLPPSEGEETLAHVREPAPVITSAGTLTLAPGNKITLTPLPGVDAAEVLAVMREIAGDRVRAQGSETATGGMV